MVIRRPWIINTNSPMQTRISPSDTPQCANSNKAHVTDVSLAESVALLRRSDDSQIELAEKVAGIFLDRILEDMAEDLEDYKETFDVLVHLHDFINKVEFRFGGHSSSGELDSVQGVYEKSGCFEMNITGFQPIPLSQLRSGRLVLANQTIWTFDATSRDVENPIVASFDDSQLILELAGDHIGALTVRGVVDGLKQEDCQSLKEGCVTNLMTLLICDSEDGTKIAGTFTPQTFIYQDRLKILVVLV
jgi:hypothetical protein